MDDKTLFDFTTDELIAELVNRDEINKALEHIETDFLIERISETKNVTELSSSRRQDYCVSIENGEMYHNSGQARILIIEE